MDEEKEKPWLGTTEAVDYIRLGPSEADLLKADQLAERLKALEQKFGDCSTIKKSTMRRRMRNQQTKMAEDL